MAEQTLESELSSMLVHLVTQIDMEVDVTALTPNVNEALAHCRARLAELHETDWEQLSADSLPM